LEPVGIAAGVGALVVVGLIALLGIAVGWWVLRRTLSMLRRLIVLGVLLALVAGAVAAGLTLAVALQVGDETVESPEPARLQPSRNPRK
jgi:hypothetical protein